jgi:hypothetical protein
MSLLSCALPTGKEHTCAPHHPGCCTVKHGLCWNTLLQECGAKSFYHIVTTQALGHIIVTFDNIVAFFISLVALQTS